MKQIEFNEFLKSHKTEVTDLLERRFSIQKTAARLNKKYFPRSSKYISTINLTKFITDNNLKYGKSTYYPSCKLTDEQLSKKVKSLMKEHRYSMDELVMLLKTPKSRIEYTLSGLFIKSSGKKLSPQQEEERQKLYKEGLVDWKIADICGVSFHSIERWRNARNLPSNYRPGTEKNLKERLDLYNQGKTDTEISAIQKITMETVFQWRKTRNLLKNENITQKLTSKSKHKQKLSLYNQGLSDKEIANKLNLSDITISLWRKHNSLKSIYKIKIAKQMSNRMKLYNQGKSDNEIATIQKVIIQSVAKWRKQHNLSPNKKNKRKSV